MRQNKYLLEAVGDGDIDGVKAALASGANVNAKSKYGSTAPTPYRCGFLVNVNSVG
jgi:ankyrin repeat protein